MLIGPAHTMLVICRWVREAAVDTMLVNIAQELCILVMIPVMVPFLVGMRQEILRFKRIAAMLMVPVYVHLMIP